MSKAYLFYKFISTALRILFCYYLNFFWFVIEVEFNCFVFRDWLKGYSRLNYWENVFKNDMLSNSWLDLIGEINCFININ